MMVGAGRMTATARADIGARFEARPISVGLAKPWAEWFTAVITGSLVPLEIFEIYRHPTIIKVIVLLLNIAIVAYLVLRIRKEQSSPTEG
jgi:uncharacterized membrane protein (DUF2068 family)